MPGYLSNTSRAALIRFSAGLAPAMPGSITMLPSKFSVSASHCAMNRASAQSVAVTKLTKLSEVTRRSTRITGMPRFIARVTAGSSASAVAGLKIKRSTSRSTRS